MEVGGMVDSFLGQQSMRCALFHLFLDLGWALSVPVHLHISIDAGD
jgi:hypothetical protein